jgi:hypothetical protein
VRDPAILDQAIQEIERTIETERADATGSVGRRRSFEQSGA